MERDKYASIIHDELNKLGIEFGRYKERWDISILFFCVHILLNQYDKHLSQRIMLPQVKT